MKCKSYDREFNFGITLLIYDFVFHSIFYPIELTLI